jgi:hypothetical protein
VDGNMHYHTRCKKCTSQDTAECDIAKGADAYSNHQSKKRKVNGGGVASKYERREQLVKEFGQPQPKKCSGCEVDLTISNAQIAKVKTTEKTNNQGVHKYRVYFNGMCDICRANKEVKRRKTFDSGTYARLKKRKAFCKKMGLPPTSTCCKCKQNATPETTAIIYKHDKYAFSNTCDKCKVPRKKHTVDKLSSPQQLTRFLRKALKQAKTRVYQNCDCKKDEVEQYVTVTEDDLVNKSREQKYNCIYCAEKLHFFNSKERNRIASIDRINPANRKYEVGNIAWCCYKCNVRKGTKDGQEYVAYLQMEEETKKRIQLKEASTQNVSSMFTQYKYE